MSCVCVDSPAGFPTSLACVIKEGYEGTLIRKKRYLGNVSVVLDNPIIGASVIVKYPSDLSIFASWWLDELDYGYLPFTLNLPFFGVTRDWQVKIKNNLAEAFIDGDLRDITLELELIEENIAGLIEAAVSESLCNICGG